MSCPTRKKWGNCSHYQCPYGISGCVDVEGDFCEIGEDCEPECEYSWDGKDKEKCKEAEKVWEEKWKDY